MGQTEKRNVLIRLTDRQLAIDWAEVLREDGYQVSIHSGEASAHPPALVVTDDCHWRLATADGPIGLILVGVDGEADAVLPPDATPRELRLACRLVAQIAQLRHQCRRHEELDRQLAQQAATDPVTGLPNRWAWNQALAERLHQAARSSNPLCLALVDLDHFKPVNDQLGHTAGDRLLRHTARILAENLRADDFLSRLGGDEFGLLLWVPDRQTAVAIIERVRGRLPEQLAAAQQPVVTASAGLALGGGRNASAELPSADELFAAADAALLRAKRTGRNRTLCG